MSATPKTPGYFYQFPLALLAAGKDLPSRYNLIIAYAQMAAGYKHDAKMSPERAQEVLEEDFPNESHDFSKRDIRAWRFGRRLVDFSFSQPCVDLYKEAVGYLNILGQSSPLVRCPVKIFRETHDGDFEYRDLSVLCAVYSIIGDKKYAIVRRDRVRAGALGYSSAKVLFDDDGNLTPHGKRLVGARQDGLKPLTINQCRYTLDFLHERKFFVRIQPRNCGRTVYYSRSMDHKALAEALLKKESKRHIVRNEREEAQAMLRQKLPSLLKRLNSGEESAPTETTALNHQTVTAEVTGGVTGGVTALIHSSPNRFCPNEFSLHGCPMPPSGNGSVSESVSDERSERGRRKSLRATS